MKIILSFTKSFLPLFFLLISSEKIHSQTPTYSLQVTNESQPSPYTYEFEVFLLNTSAYPFELEVLQFGLGYDTTILNGGNVSFQLVNNVNGDTLQPAPSELIYDQQPLNFPVGGVVYQYYPSTYYRFFNCTARIPPSLGTGTIISTNNGGCTHPGTRVGRFRMTNSVPFRPGSTCKHIWSNSPGTNRTNTIVVAYVPAGIGSGVDLTSAYMGSHYDYDRAGTCIVPSSGIILNNSSGIGSLNISNSGISIYPNPGNERMTVNSQEKIINFQLFSTSGNLVYANKPLSDKLDFDVQNYSSGLYFYKAELIGGAMSTGKIIIE